MNKIDKLKKEQEELIIKLHKTLDEVKEMKGIKD